jgi:hypothetical protein
MTVPLYPRQVPEVGTDELVGRLVEPKVRPRAFVANVDVAEFPV